MEVVKPEALDDALTDRWLALRAAEPTLASPFFHPQFTAALAENREDVFIAIASRAGEITALLPFHKRRFGAAAAIGGQISDFQGVIAERPDPAIVKALLTQAKLAAYDFNHGLATQEPLATNAFAVFPSPVIDLTAGFDAWASERKAARISDIKTLDRKSRKLASDHGDLRLIFDDRDDTAWRMFVEWKCAALKSLGVQPFNSVPWMLGTLKSIRNAKDAEFGGVLNSLYAGDRLAAVHFGMKSGAVLHWWYPTFDAALARYSPGLILLMKLAETQRLTGITRIDLGRGDERYKSSFANAATEVCEGSVARAASMAGAVRAARVKVQRALVSSARPGVADFTRRAGNRLLSACRLP